MSVGDRVKKIIQRRGLSQDDLASKIGLDKSGMSKLLNNKRKVEESLLLKLSLVLGITSDELLGREENDNVSKEESSLERKIRELHEIADRAKTEEDVDSAIIVLKSIFK